MKSTADSRPAMSKVLPVTSFFVMVVTMESRVLAPWFNSSIVLKLAAAVAVWRACVLACKMFST